MELRHHHPASGACGAAALAARRWSAGKPRCRAADSLEERLGWVAGWCRAAAEDLGERVPQGPCRVGGSRGRPPAHLPVRPDQDSAVVGDLADFRPATVRAGHGDHRHGEGPQSGIGRRPPCAGRRPRPSRGRPPSSGRSAGAPTATACAKRSSLRELFLECYLPVGTAPSPRYAANIDIGACSLPIIARCNCNVQVHRAISW